jgi:hypothetical protein
MKINDLLHGQKITGTSTAKQPQETGANFQDMLANRLQSMSETASTTAIQSVGRTESIPASLRIEGLGISDAAIDTLESFSAALGNRAIAAGALEPFAADLEEKTAAILDIREQLPTNDPLGMLLDRVATTAYVESAKYRRGDYSS